MNDETLPLDVQSILEEIKEEYLIDDLATMVMKDYQVARDHQVNSGVYDDLLLSLRAASRKYSQEEKAACPEGVEIYIGLTAAKIRAGKAWISDLLANSQDQPFTLEPTPIPKLPDDIKKAIVSMLQQEIADLEISPEEIENNNDKLRKLTKTLKLLGFRHADRLAKEATERMEKLIADQLLESGWRGAMQGVVHDVLTFQYGMMLGPRFRQKRKMNWDGNNFVERTELTMEFSRVSPFDAYPSPDSKDTQNGEYFIILDKTTPSKLYEMIGSDSAMRDDEIKEVIKMYGKSGYRIDVDSQRDNLEGTEDGMHAPNTIDVVQRYGRISGEKLSKYIDVPDESKYYETIIYCVKDYVIYAALNNYPLEVRPLRHTSYQKIPGKFAGEGLGLILDECARLMNASARSLALNIAFLGEPLGEYDLERMEETADPTRLSPGSMFAVNTDVGAQQGPAIRLMKVPNSINEILAVMNNVKLLADELSGIPPYVMGGTPAGGVGRTLGGLTAMLGNAAKGIKDVIGNIEQDIVEQVVILMYNYNMLTNPDMSIKADAQVKARASQGIMQREMAQSKSIEALATVVPFFQAGVIEKQGMQVLLREVLSGMGQPVDKIIPDPLRNAEITRTLENASVSSAPATPSPQLDGRSIPQTQ